MTLNNTTIADNGTGGGLADCVDVPCSAPPSTFTIRNSILANNATGDCLASVTANYSLIEDTAGCTISGSNNVTGMDPNLGALTPGLAAIRPLQLPSPAYNAASPAAYNSGGEACLGIDQQKEGRGGGGRCDMGADELLVPDLKLTKTDAPDPVVLGSGSNVVYTLTTKNLAVRRRTTWPCRTRCRLR